MKTSNRTYVGWYAGTVLLIVATLLLAGCVPATPVPTAQRGLTSTFSEDAFFEHAVTVGGDLAVTGQITGGSFTPATFATATNIYADVATITTTLVVPGKIVADSGTFTTALQSALVNVATAVKANSGTYTTALQSALVNVTGKVIADNGTYTTALQSALVNVATTVKAAGVTVTNTLQADAVNAVAKVTAATATITGTVQAGALFGTGAVNGSTGSFTTTATVGTFLVLTPGATQTLYEGTPITPTASYQPVTASYDMGTSAIVIKPAGTILRIVNLGTPTVKITDTGTIMLSANWTGGQYDSLTLMSDGTNWLELARSDN